MEWRTTLNDFEEHLVQSRLERGYDYFTEGKLSDLAEDNPGTWHAVVTGNSNYDVRVELADRTIRTSSCNCPNKVEYCKHVIAMLYAIRQRKNGHENIT